MGEKTLSKIFSIQDIFANNLPYCGWVGVLSDYKHKFGVDITEYT